MRKKRVLIIVAAAVCILSAVIAFGIKSRNARSTQNAKSERPQGSLREKARQQGGHYLGTVRPVETTRYDDVESLAKASTLVVTGSIQESKSFVPPANDRLIITGHQLLVQDVVQGLGKSVEAGDWLTVETLGGKIQFEDGSTAELKAPDIFKDPQVGKPYLFFLRRHKAAYRLVGGPQGLFEINDLGRITAQVPPNDTLARKYDNETLDSMIASIRGVSSRK